ncbi:DUF6915 family protein [Nocardia sp. NPDC003963]
MAQSCAPSQAGSGMLEPRSSMAQSWLHAEASARHFGGSPDDYIAIHEWIDAFKSIVGDVTHRQYRHNSHGPWMAHSSLVDELWPADEESGYDTAPVEQKPLTDFIAALDAVFAFPEV